VSYDKAKRIYEYVVNIDELRKQVEELSKNSIVGNISPRNYEVKFHLDLCEKDIENIISVLKMLKGIESVKAI